jgi:hypothetical protein
MQLKHLVLILLILLGIPLASASWCYQEFANVTPECGGLSTGKYAYSGNWLDPAINAYDGDYSTSATPWNSVPIIYVNYSVPFLCQSNPKWQILDNPGNSIRNLTIPVSCRNNRPLQFMMTGEVFINSSFFCMNTTNDYILLYNSSADHLSEEGMWWNCTSINTNGQTCYQEQANESNSCGGLETGSYSFYGFAGNYPKGPQSAFIDGNWSSWWALDDSLESGVVINYVRNTTYYPYATWFFEYYGSACTLQNVSVAVPSACLANITLNLSVNAAEQINVACFNGTSFVPMYYDTMQTGSCKIIYEDAILYSKTLSSCSYSGTGDWAVQQNCTINTNQNLQGNKVIFNGGQYIINATISNWSRITAINGSHVTVINGNKLTR